MAFVTTVADNMQFFTHRQIERAKEARRAYGMVGTPSPSDFKNMVRGQSIKIFSVTNEDIKVAHKNFGPDVSSLEGKTTRNRPDPVLQDIVAVPAEILSLHRNVVLTADIVFINKLTFMVTQSRKLCFRTIQYVRSRKKK